MPDTRVFIQYTGDEPSSILLKHRCGRGTEVGNLTLVRLLEMRYNMPQGEI